MNWRIVLLALVLPACLPHAARAQLTPQEYNEYLKLLSEPENRASWDKRLKLIGDAIDREADPKKPPNATNPVDLKMARIAAAEGVPFLLKRLDNSSESVRKTVLRMLAAYGAEAKSAVPETLERLKTDASKLVRAEAMLTLPRLDPTNKAGAEALLEQLGTDDQLNRAALRGLALMPSTLPLATATPKISKFLEHRSADLPFLAYETLGKMIALERPSLEQLKALKQIDWKESPDKGYAVLAAIGGLGPKADFAVPLALTILDSMPPAYLECAVLDTLLKVRTGNPKAIEAVLARLTAKNFVVRGRARSVLQNLDFKQPESVRALAAGLRDPDRMKRLDVADTLRVCEDSGRIPANARAEMLAPLLETLNELDATATPRHLENYLSLLRRFGPKAKAAAEPLFKFYQDEAYFKKLGQSGLQLHTKILAALANIGVPDGAKDLMLEILQKGPQPPPDNGFAFAAAAHAAPAFAKASDAVPLLLPGLKSTGQVQALYFIDWSGDTTRKGTTVRLETIRALAAFGPAAEAALPALKEIAEEKEETSIDLEMTARLEARKAYAKIAGAALPALKGIFADGTKEKLHLDERLKVPMSLTLRNARPPDMLRLLEEATKLKFTMDENVDPEVLVTASMQSMGVPAYMMMRQLAAARTVEGTWEDTGDGYLLHGKKRTAEEKAALLPKTPFPPFRDDTNDPMMKDSRLQKGVNLRLDRASLQTLLRTIGQQTDVPLFTENLDDESPLGGFSVNNTSAWMILRNIAEMPKVQGKWTKVGDGYSLRGTRPLQVARAAAAAGALPPVVAEAQSPPPRGKMLIVLAAGFVVLILVAAGVALVLRGRRQLSE